MKSRSRNYAWEERDVSSLLAPQSKMMPGWFLQTNAIGTALPIVTCKLSCFKFLRCSFTITEHVCPSSLDRNRRRGQCFRYIATVQEWNVRWMPLKRLCSIMLYQNIPATTLNSTKNLIDRVNTSKHEIKTQFSKATMPVACLHVF